jgi:hypothetical protein
VNEKDLLSVSYSSTDRSVSFTYEPHAPYLFADLIAYADEMADHIHVYEGGTHMVSLKKVGDGWVELMTPPKAAP